MVDKLASKQLSVLVSKVYIRPSNLPIVSPIYDHAEVAGLGEGRGVVLLQLDSNQLGGPDHSEQVQFVTCIYQLRKGRNSLIVTYGNRSFGDHLAVH